MIESLVNSPDYLLLYLFGLPLLAMVNALVLKDATKQATMVILIGTVLFAFMVYLMATLLWQVFDIDQALKFWQITLLPDITLKFVIEPWGTLFVLVASLLWPITTLFSLGYLKATKATHTGRFHACFALAIFAVMGIAFSGNLVTLFLAYEVLTLCTYPLVIHDGTPQAMRAGRIYLGYLLGTSLTLFLGAILYVGYATGTYNFVPSGTLEGAVSPYAAGILLFCFAYGIGKTALMPLHRWLPEAMVAPAPVSALLHAVAVVKGGAFAFVKIAVYVFGVDYLAKLPATHWLIIIAGVSVILSSLQALRTNNLKQMLAYSTISQLSTIVMLTCLAVPPGIEAAGFQLAAHAVGKITLFLAAGAIYAVTKKTQIHELSGTARELPIVFIAFIIGAMAMVGLPPTAGMMSKWLMLTAAIDAERPFVLGVLLLSTLLNAFYFSKVIWIMMKPPVAKNNVLTAGWPMHVALGLTSTAVVLLFLWPLPILQLASKFSGL